MCALEYEDNHQHSLHNNKAAWRTYKGFWYLDAGGKIYLWASIKPQSRKKKAQKKPITNQNKKPNTTQNKQKTQ